MLVAIDGTSSRSWRRPGNSHVHRFHDAYRGARLYRDGPSAFISGRDLWPAVNVGMSFIDFNLRALGPNEPVDLVGHSRGGMGVIVIAQRLKERHIGVRFLGLFDAVDRTLTLEFGVIPDNVRYARHAIRDPLGHSRTSFGNTGTHSAGGVNYKSQLIFGTHSALGGDPWHGDHPSVLNATLDNAAAHNAYSYIAREAKAVGVPLT